MLHLAALVLSWLGVWVSEHSVEPSPCHCNCTCTIERIECPDCGSSWWLELFKFILYLIIGAGVASFQLASLAFSVVKKRLTKFLEGNVTESSDRKGSLTSGTGVALIQGAESNQQEIARQQLALLRRRRAVP